MQPLADFQNSTKSLNDFIQLLLTGTGNREYDTTVFKMYITILQVLIDSIEHTP
jgi:hypothetical protein